ncbi:response regulator [Piscinibacter sakaiensis]|uniref:response regulator n=1 Tax=Piscinibacter sakaiensis TaxID=1547922 RepID=UPI003AAC27CF
MSTVPEPNRPVVPPSSAAPIMIVEDDAIQALDLKQQLRAQGYRVVGIAGSAEEAEKLAEREWPSLVLMDVRLQHGPDGVDLAAQLNAKRALPVLFVTAYSDPETVHRAARIGAYGFITKPYEERELRAAVEVALAKAALERRPAAEERWFAQSLRCVQDGVLLTDANGRLLFLNPLAEGWTGWAEIDANGRPLSEVLNLEPAQGIGTGDPAAALHEAVMQGSVLQMLPAVAAVARNRTRTLLDISCAPIGDERGRRVGSVIQLRNAAERQALDQRRHGGLQRFRTAFEQAPLGMALVTTDGRLLEVNDALCTMLGHRREALLELRQFDLTVAEDRVIEAQMLALLARGDRAIVQFERRCQHADGTPLWSLTSVSKVADPAAGDDHDHASLLLYQVVDFRAQREVAQGLATAGAMRLQQQIDSAVEMTTHAILSRASHELRTPLNAVLGLAQLLQSTEASTMPDRVKAYAGLIVNAGGRLLKLVNDLLDLQSADVGTLAMSMATVGLRGQIDQTLQPLREAAERAGVKIRNEVPDDLRVRADPIRLRQLLAELADNVIKHAHTGSLLRWSVGPRMERPMVSLRIDDCGPGMSDEERQQAFRLFQRLGRVDDAGPGLGLALARRLAERMGGKLTLDTSPEQGMRVVLMLRGAE